MTQPSQAFDRQIRVFISSTFRDMQAERDELVKKIFPQLRKMCEERAVTWTEVDLRWGITTEQSAEGKVLPLCLEEIQRCRPYFIGLLGERYGWVPDSIPVELFETQPWLKEHLHKSVTELEILHGVLSDPEMKGHAFFYFRDPQFIEKVPESERGGFVAEGPESVEKLRDLKNKIRAAEAKGICRLKENYPEPEALGEWILDDFTKLIERLYPKEEAPDPLDQEAARHEAYARSRRVGFVGREGLIEQIDRHAAAPEYPIVLTGESGGGKSALLAEWTARWSALNPDDLIIQHYIGSTSSSADWQGVVRRIVGELKREFDIPDQIPTDTDVLRNALLDWTTKAAGNRRVVLVLDALNQLSDEAAGRQLGWLPMVFPRNFFVVLSTLEGESLDALHRRGWPELNVPLFSMADIKHTALAYFSIFSKTPPDELITRLEETPAACNALYLRAVLDELRQFGRHEQLEAKAEEYLSAPDLPDLFDRILTRWDEDFGHEEGYDDLVREAMCLIACSRYGLSEGELLDLLGNEDGPLPHQYWTPLYLAAEHSLSLNSGLIRFGHEALRSAVERRWLPDGEQRRTFHLRIADYFDQQEISPRKAAELPWQLREARERDRLRRSMLDIPLMLANFTSDPGHVLGYWIWLDEEQEMGEAYLDSFDAWAESPGLLDLDLYHVAFRVGEYLCLASLYDEAEPLFRLALRLVETSRAWSPPTDIASVLYYLARLLTQTGRFDEAELMMRQALVRGFQNYGSYHPNFARDLCNLAMLLQRSCQFSESELLIRQALEININSLGQIHPNVASTISVLAQLQHDQSLFEEAERYYREALSIDEQYFGDKHYRIAIDLDNLSSLLIDTDRHGEAEPLCHRALAINEDSFGPHHPSVGASLNNLANLLRVTNRFAEAEPLYRRALAIGEESHGPDHPKVAVGLNNLAELLRATNRLAEAEPLFWRALNISEKSWGENNPNVAQVLNYLVGLLRDTNRLSEAEPLMRRALEIDENSFDPEHPAVAIDLNNLAGLLYTTNRFAEAEPLYGRALAIDEKSYGPDHPRVATSLNNLAGLLRATNRLAEAEPLFRRAVEICRRSLGEDHPSTVRIKKNLEYLLKEVEHQRPGP